MGNEYKDWERDKIAEEKEIVKKYPFLRVRDIDGTIDTSAHFPMIGLDIPNGWYQLFFQMCDDLKPVLEKEGMLNDFYFVQVKEKFNELRCYSGHWETSEIQDILRKYEYLSRFVCTVCGLPTEYETQGYIASYCDKCLDKIKTIDRIVPIEFTDTFETVRYSKEGNITTIHDISKEWERYKESLWVEE